MSLQKILNEFKSVVDAIYGVYLDSGHGFLLNRIEMIELQDKNVINKGLTIEAQDKKSIKFNSSETGSISDSYTLHECSQDEYKIRNKRNGSNFVIQANLCLTQIYSYWEDHFREKIADCVGINKDEITSDIFGDISYLRQSIIHNQAIAIRKISKCKIIKWFKTGDKIQMDEYMFEHIISLVKHEIDILYNNFSKK